ncbi:hypothetical protein HZS_2927 [Henneguya salminicola]|nr:hypothetical protein HZS_2927 [Henneguya salminicola]
MEIDEANLGKNKYHCGILCKSNILTDCFKDSPNPGDSFQHLPGNHYGELVELPRVFVEYNQGSLD